MLYKLGILNRGYTKYTLTNNNEILEFSNPDLIKGIYDSSTVEYTHNDIRCINNNVPERIPGILELYSKYQYKANSKGVPMYVFVPINNCYPKALVASTLKKKYTENIFITINYVSWEKDNIFPKGHLDQTFGGISNFPSIESVLLAKHNLNVSEKRPKLAEVRAKYEKLIEEDHNDRYTIDKNIISIDPEGCTDIDDAFTIEKDSDIIKLSIHIVDVFYILYNLDILDIVKKPSSIYLKDNIKHMLFPYISSDIGSLIEKNKRFMLTLSIVYNSKTEKIEDITFRKSIGIITKNYNYDNYPKKINNYFKDIEKVYNLITNDLIKINDSHKFIEALMIIYNTYFCSSVPKSATIYRIQKNKNYISNQSIDDRLDRFLKLIKSYSAEYSKNKETHSSLGIDNYTHATSPLRRLVDLINQSLYYGNDTLIKMYDLDKINIFNKRLKKFYRDLDKMYLSYSIYHSEEYCSTCYIYDVNITKQLVYLYFPNENISTKYRFVDYRIVDIVSINNSNSEIVIELADKTKRIPLYRETQVMVYGKPDIFNIDKSIIIEFT